MYEINNYAENKLHDIRNMSNCYDYRHYNDVSRHDFLYRIINWSGDLSYDSI